jgi:hypothetical protein
MPKLTNINRPSPQELPLFRSLVRSARERQNGSLTARQYRRLLSVYLASQLPIVEAPLACFFYGGVHSLQKALAAEGLSVRPPVYRHWKTPFRLKQKGWARLEELAGKMGKSRS